MGIIVNTINNLQDTIGHIEQVTSHSCQLYHSSKVLGNQCPILNKCRDIRQGVTQGDFIFDAFNGGLLGAYVMHNTGIGNSKVIKCNPHLEMMALLIATQTFRKQRTTRSPLITTFEIYSDMPRPYGIQD